MTPNILAKNLTVSLTVKAEGLSKRFGELIAVDEISFSVAQGECLAILGPNGAGKTTTCEMLEGLIAPDSGTIEILGLRLDSHRQELLEKIGVQLQETALYKKYTVRETVELFASFYQQPVTIDVLLAKLDLSEKQHARLEHLSGGQKQRAYLACSLINNPQVLFLDEPTTGLDPQARRYIWDLLCTLKGEGRSLVLTTHNMEEAQALADRIAIMDRGKILALDTYEKLLERYCGAKVLSFELSDPAHLTSLRAQLAWLAPARLQGERCEVEVEQASDFLQQLIRAADHLQIKIASLALRQSTLEDVFLQITGRKLQA